MATRPEQTSSELKVDPASLYQEEIFTDRRVGTIRRLTPIKKDGARDTARAVLYVGETRCSRRRARRRSASRSAPARPGRGRRRSGRPRRERTSAPGKGR